MTALSSYSMTVDIKEKTLQDIMPRILGHVALSNTIQQGHLIFSRFENAKRK